MLSLAPLRYRRILHRHGGPVERLECGAGARFHGGTAGFHAAAYLSETLFPAERRRRKTSFDAPDGAGTHESAQIACHMAVSEAIERWALHHLRAHGVADRYGLDIDPSSNGFAAFPGLTSRPARKKARAEAIERHCLLCWWEGSIGHHFIPDPAPGVKGIRLDTTPGQSPVVVLWAVHRSLHYTYGFGIGGDVEEACRRALIERERCNAIIDHHLGTGKNESIRDADIARMEDTFERRIAHFSRAGGFRLFHERLKRQSHGKAENPEIYFDGPVKGPWSKFASVWRTVIVPPTRKHLSDATDYFFW